jgi:hypothetical protein
VRTLLVGDVHGCSGPLRALLREARPDRLVLLGDLFAKGPDPRGVWDIIRDTGAEAVLGNHDARLLDVWGTPGDTAHHVAARALSEEAREWTARLPLFLFGDCWIGVHAGLHPTEGIFGTTRRLALAMRRWPDDANLDNPFWWQVYTRAERVFYGHDAVRGLQLHARTIGLDTGCVYGNLLSGYLLEEERVVQVPASG